MTFRYPNEEREALRDVSISIKAGEKVALLGRIGCGKSSLNKLVLGFISPLQVRCYSTALISGKSTLFSCAVILAMYLKMSVFFRLIA